MNDEGLSNHNASLQVRGIFGFVGEDHIGKVMFPPVQVSVFMNLSGDFMPFVFWGFLQMKGWVF